MVATSRRDWRVALTGGVLSGLVGGIALSLFMLSMNLLKAQDIWGGMKFAGVPFLGERALQPGYDLTAVLVGIGTHLAVSIGWGVLFGLLVQGMSRGFTVVAGLLYGVGVWLGMYYLVMPAAGLGALVQGVPIAQAVLTHMLFGLVTALTMLPFQPRVIRGVHHHHDGMVPA